MGLLDYYKANPNAQERFDRGMANLASAENPVVSRAYDFGKFGRIVAVG